MNTHARHWLLALVLAGALCATCRAEEDAPLHQLRRDPFDFSAIIPPEPEMAPGPTPAEQAVTFELRATLVAKHRSLANLNGEILGVGDEIDGYRLRRIDEDQVVLEKAGKQITVLQDQ